MFSWLRKWRLGRPSRSTGTTMQSAKKSESRVEDHESRRSKDEEPAPEFLVVNDSFPFSDDFYRNHLLVSPEGIGRIRQMTSRPLPIRRNDEYGFCSGHYGDHAFHAHKNLGPESSSAYAAACTVVGQLTTPSPIMPEPYFNMFGGLFQFWIKGSKLGYRMFLFL